MQPDEQILQLLCNRCQVFLDFPLSDFQRFLAPLWYDTISTKQFVGAEAVLLHR